MGASVGMSAGASVGTSGKPVGISVGASVGGVVGKSVGELVGKSVGEPVGKSVGDPVGVTSFAEVLITHVNSASLKSLYACTWTYRMLSKGDRLSSEQNSRGPANHE